MMMMLQKAIPHRLIYLYCFYLSGFDTSPLPTYLRSTYLTDIGSTVWEVGANLLELSASDLHIDCHILILYLVSSKSFHYQFDHWAWKGIYSVGTWRRCLNERGWSAASYHHHMLLFESGIKNHDRRWTTMLCALFNRHSKSFYYHLSDILPILATTADWTKQVQT